MLVGFGVRLRFQDEGLAIILLATLLITCASLVPAREFTSDANISYLQQCPCTIIRIP